MESFTGFNGERMDPVNGTAHLGNGYRACHPVLRRFSAPDSWSPFGTGGVNPYAYCAGDPVNRADPSGQMSVGQWVGMGIGLIAGIALSIVTDGTALPVVASLIVMVTGNATIGASAELVAEAVDGQRINWGQVGVAAGISAAAVLAGYGLGRAASRLTGTVRRPFGRLMFSGGGIVRERATGDLPGLGGQFRNPVFHGIYKPGAEEQARIALSFVDYFDGGDRLNIVGVSVLPEDGRGIHTMGGGIWSEGHYVPTRLSQVQLADLVEGQREANWAIRSVRLAVPNAGRTMNRSGTLRAKLQDALLKKGIVLSVTAPKNDFVVQGPAYTMLSDMLAAADSGVGGAAGAHQISPGIYQAALQNIADRFADTPGAFNIDFE